MIGAKRKTRTMNEISKRLSRCGRRIVIAFVAAAVLAPGRGLIVYGQETAGGSAQASQRANAPEALTLPLAVEIALRTNPLMRATASGREIADAQAQEAKAGRFPLVQLSETWINGNNPVFVFGSLLEQGRFTQQNFNLTSLNNPDPLNNFRFGVTIKAPLFDQRQTSTRVVVAKPRSPNNTPRSAAAGANLRRPRCRTTRPPFERRKICTSVRPNYCTTARTRKRCARFGYD
jgi:hypothetical protein